MNINDLKVLLPSYIKHRYRTKLSSYYKGLTNFSTNSKIIVGKLKRQFIRPSFPDLDGVYNLHIGCGNIKHNKFVNIDGLPDSHIHYVRNIDDLSFLPENKVDLIYASHCLEHFSHLRVEQVLAEWFRVLKKEGILRLSVPDFDLLLGVYKDNENSVNSVISPLMGGQDYKYNFHMTIFNHSSLTELLLKAGFSQVRAWTPGSEELTTFDDYSVCKILVNGKYYPVSLNLEAIK
ncbi:methyltransferase domain-containing protein [Pseudanabaena sp. FACHB-1998]|uniref:class I SAM-dependent methyltransferase n=1 Tax=Pseudanabaena sp. FACHB-1998 TaxID=2692858 RepID=UPI001681ACED|nr:methyltransferase domain-containing protein [Pseudanabaena sp. FACHB-1998]MBD2179007.1 methyltransferase domain-containing protein [Pseudanabaena sp. FACHB-1998]